MKRVLILGATGSIGTNALYLINNMQEEFCLCGVQAHSNKNQLIKIIYYDFPLLNNYITFAAWDYIYTRQTKIISREKTEFCQYKIRYRDP